MWTIDLTSVNDQQILLYLPLALADSLPKAYLAEFKQLSANQLRLSFVDPATPARAKRYKVVRHNSGAWVSVPRPWLRDRSARKSDVLHVTQTTPETFLIDLIRKP